MSFLPDPLHPAVVHFPIALVFVALLFEVLARVRRWRGLETAAALLVVLAALAAVATVLSGSLAADAAVVPRAAAPVLDHHEELGETAMWVLLVLAAVRLLLARMQWYGGWAAWLFLAALAVAVGMVAWNGHLGGELVFDHGVGTAPVQEHALPEL